MLLANYPMFLCMLIGDSLESPYWLLFDFCPKILGDGGDLHMMVFARKLMQSEWWGYSTPNCCLKKSLFILFLFTLLGSGDTITLDASTSTHAKEPHGETFTT